jgi:hypothetical protein
MAGLLESAFLSMARTQEQNPHIGIAGVVAACLLCIWGAAQHYRFESAYQQQNRDRFLIAEQFTRFASLLRAVPEQTELGYLTDVPPGSAEDGALLLSAQYVLAPRLLAKTGSHEWVLGNFTHPGDFVGIGRNNGLRLQQDFGNGVVLYRRER